MSRMTQCQVIRRPPGVYIRLRETMTSAGGADRRLHCRAVMPSALLDAVGVEIGVGAGAIVRGDVEPLVARIECHALAVKVAERVPGRRRVADPIVQVD